MSLLTRELTNIYLDTPTMAQILLEEETVGPVSVIQTTEDDGVVLGDSECGNEWACVYIHYVSSAGLVINWMRGSEEEQMISVHSPSEKTVFPFEYLLVDGLTPIPSKIQLVLILWKAPMLTIIPPVLNPTHSLSENSHLNYPRCLSLLPKFTETPFFELP